MASRHCARAEAPLLIELRVRNGLPAEARRPCAKARLRQRASAGSLRLPRRSWRRLVGSAGNAPVRRFRLYFLKPVALRKQVTVELPDHFPWSMGAGVGVTPT
jgi:hypothetical protein